MGTSVEAVALKGQSISHTWNMFEMQMSRPTETGAFGDGAQ